MIARVPPTTEPADPQQWSEKSKQSYAYFYKRTYEDRAYQCWHCQAASVFTAQDQKYTFEIKKASIDQRRILCQTCWSESNRVRKSLREFEQQWGVYKATLQHDANFLDQWLSLLLRLEKFVPYRPDTAKKNMLSKLLAKI